MGSFPGRNMCRSMCFLSICTFFKNKCFLLAWVLIREFECENHYISSNFFPGKHGVGVASLLTQRPKFNSVVINSIQPRVLICWPHF